MSSTPLSTHWYMPCGHSSLTVRNFLLKNGWIKEEQYHLEDVDDKLVLEVVPDLSDQNLLRLFNFVVEYNFPRVLKAVLEESRFRQSYPVTYDQIDASLKKCCKKGHAEIVKILSENGANIHIDQDYPMRLAATGGHTRLVEYLINHGADVHSRDNFALIMSSRYGFESTVDLLIERGADGSARNYAAITDSAKNGYLNITRKLFSVFLKLETSESYLYWALEQENYELITYLLNMIEDYINLPKLITRILQDDDLLNDTIKHMLYILYERGVDMSTEDNLALRLVCSKCDIEMVEFLIKLGASPRDPVLLQICAHTPGCLEILRLLILNGLDVDDLDSETLMLCLSNRNYIMVELLLEHSDPNNISDTFIEELKRTDNDMCRELVQTYFSQ